MKLPRRKFLHLAAGAAALPGVTRIARAQTWPTRVVRLLVGFPPGGGMDSAGRIVASRLSEVWVQQVVIENKTGLTRRTKEAKGNVFVLADMRLRSSAQDPGWAKPLPLHASPALHRRRDA